MPPARGAGTLRADARKGIPSNTLNGPPAPVPALAGSEHRPARLDPPVLLLLAAGALLRVVQYLANRSLWLDEAYVAPTILHRSFRDLLSRPPEHGQILPAGFLLLERAATAVFGGGEYALRLPPLLAGLAGLLLFRRIAARTLPGPAAALALMLFVFCNPHIQLSSELKPYTLDAAIALLLLDRALAVGQSGAGTRPLFGLALAGALAVWFSNPSVFVLAGIGATLSISALRRRDRALAAGMAAAGILWAASFGLCNALWLSRIGRAENVLAFWSHAFLPLPPRSVAELFWLPTALGAVFGDPVGFVFRGLGIFCFLAGAAALFGTSRVRLSLLTSPILFVLLASGLKRYPFEGRLLLFLVPSLLLLVALGAARVRETTAAQAPAIGWILVVLLLFHPVLFAARALIHPPSREEIKPVLAGIRGSRRAGDRLYVYAAAAPAFDYYAGRYGFSAGDALRGTFAGGDGDPLRDVERLRGGGRTWLLFSHAQRGDGTDDERRFLALLDPLGARLETLRASGVAAFLYDLRGGKPD